jgi:hypothetical protein
VLLVHANIDEKDIICMSTSKTTSTENNTGHGFCFQMLGDTDQWSLLKLVYWVTFVCLCNDSDITVLHVKWSL